MRYGPIDLTPFGGALSAVGVVYWLLALGALLWIWMSKNSSGGKVVLSLIVVALFGFLPGRVAWDDYQARQRLDASMALFKKRCETAGERIHRTAENVEGVVWMKWRDKAEDSDDYDQYKLFDPYGRDCTEQECLVKLLRATEGLELDPQRKEHYHKGYRFVESINPQDGKTYRHTLRLYRPFDRDPKWLETLIRAELVSMPIEEKAARYGLTWDDISTKEDRDHWIAGGRLKVIDLQTNEVMAERTGYMIDIGQGSRAGFRTPWAFASDNACPPKVDEKGNRTQIGFMERFSENVLKPTKGN